MKILITNAVTLNGGDYAILTSTIKLITKISRSKCDFIVYDLQSDVARKYYPKIDFRQSLYTHYSRERLQILMEVATSPNYNTQLLTSEEKIDYYNYTNADLIISTGGTYLTENYSLNGRIFDYFFCLNLGKPLIFFTQSIGSFVDQNNKFFFKKIFENADLILLRDTVSLNNLLELGIINKHIKTCSDVVFAEAELNLLEKAKLKKMPDKLKIGISVREWKYFKSVPVEQGRNNYMASIVKLCEYLTVELESQIMFISTCQGIIEYHTDDSQFAMNIFNSLSTTAQMKTKVNVDFHNPTELSEIIRGFDLVISTRMHFAIQALNVGVPVFPIAYEFKTIELFNKLINSNYIIDIEDFKEVNIIEVFVSFMNDVDASRGHLFTKVYEEHLSAIQSAEHVKRLFFS